MLDENFLSQSKVVYMYKISYGQIKNSLEEEKGFDFMSIFVLDSSLIFLSILELILVLMILIKLIRLKPFSSKLYLILRNLFETNFELTKTFNAIALIIIFYNIYFMIFKLILTLNIKSSMVILNTTAIVDNND